MNIMIFEKKIFDILTKIKINKSLLEKDSNSIIINNLFRNFFSFSNFSINNISF